MSPPHEIIHSEKGALLGKERRLATRRTLMSRAAVKRWSKRVTETSNALDLDQNVFKKDSPREIAKSLKRSAERSKRRKSEPFRSAMSMLNFYINRAGKNLPKKQKETLEKAKDELRDLYQRPRRAATKS
jgi:Protein of unknown function (DUF3175)